MAERTVKKRVLDPTTRQAALDPSVWVIAALLTLLHLLTNSRYGLHRDELQTLSDALHMDWGFVAYPPFTPFVERIAMAIFGHWLVGLRLFAVIAQAAVVVVTGMMARELGGGRLAQAAAALSVALAPLPMFEGTEFQYTTFDYLWWVLIAYFVVRLLKTDDPRWCLAIGATIGVGLLTKYTMCFYVAGIVAGIIFTPARKFLASRWLWIGAGVALVVCLPNLIWQARHGFISYHFLHYIHVRDVGEGRAEGFWRDQFRICTNLFSVPIWIAGLICFLRDHRYRMLAWMYLVPLALFAVSKARFYYLGAAYPALLAMGSVAAVKWIESLSQTWRRTAEGAFFAGIIGYGVFAAAILIPIASGGPLKQFALKNNNDLREEIGWDDLVKTVADIRDSLPAEQRDNTRVLVGNYGEGGAIEILGPAYHLPPPIMLTNSGWLRGYPTPPPSTLIVVGWSKERVERTFSACRLAGHNGNSEGVKNEESEDNPDIFVCGPPLQPWPKFWEQNQRFG